MIKLEERKVEGTSRFMMAKMMGSSTLLPLGTFSQMRKHAPPSRTSQASTQSHHTQHPGYPTPTISHPPPVPLPHPSRPAWVANPRKQTLLLDSHFSPKKSKRETQTPIPRCSHHPPQSQNPHLSITLRPSPKGRVASHHQMEFPLQ